ncbi:hypothetical protein EI94DRAFT_1709924 [Lactarius quietus]|nr:hypothetical protein EI94DRAFT_1709924 [Lactarius quietus]
MNLCTALMAIVSHKVIQEVFTTPKTAPEHFTYVEWFSPIPITRGPNHRLYKVTRLAHNGHRRASIIPRESFFLMQGGEELREQTGGGGGTQGADRVEGHREQTGWRGAGSRRGGGVQGADGVEGRKEQTGWRGAGSRRRGGAQGADGGRAQGADGGGTGRRPGGGGHREETGGGGVTGRRPGGGSQGGDRGGTQGERGGEVQGGGAQGGDGGVQGGDWVGRREEMGEGHREVTVVGAAPVGGGVQGACATQSRSHAPFKKVKVSPGRRQSAVVG